MKFLCPTARSRLNYNGSGCLCVHAVQVQRRNAARFRLAARDTHVEQLRKTEKRPFSWPAIASVIFGIASLTGAGLVAIPLGAIGLIRTRGGVRRGRKTAKWGLGLGLFSLCVNLTGCPGVFFPPPLGAEDRGFAKFLDDLSASQYQQLRGEIRVANSSGLSETEFARWVDAFNQHNGPGRMLWPAGKTIFADSARIYYVRFNKTGICKVQMYSDEDATGWILFFPLRFPNVGDQRFSDHYFNDPEYRE